MVLLLSLLLACGRRSEDISDADVVPETRISATPATEDLPTSDEAHSVPAVDEPLAPSEPVVQVILPAGGEIVVDVPGSPIDGLSIKVPVSSYAGPTEFAISYRPFEGLPPADITPITPVIEVENGGEYANDILTVTVPIDLPAHHFAMGFFLQQDGSLEGMPIVELTDNTITVATMHFSSFFISMIADSLLTGTFDTGFRPGSHDWQFDNYGSYVAPGGHCAGQCLAAVWYYYERGLHGAPQLYGLYDNNGGDKTPNLWEDDSDAYRLCSVVQRDYENSPLGNRILEGLQTAALGSDEDNWRALLYAMLVTGEPQMVTVSDADTAHAMIVYRADAEAGTLFVADPNYHADTSRVIHYASGTFSSYVSGDSKSGIEAGEIKSFDRIRYLAKSAYVFWSQIGARWSQFDAGTIGDDAFPAYRLVYRDPNTAEWLPLKDGMQFSGDRVYIAAAFEGQLEPLSVYRPSGEAIEKDADFNVPLTPGENILGIEIDRPLGESYEYVDFQWIRIDRIEAEIQVKVEVQVHADIRRINVPDPSVGFEGQTVDHDTPLEKLTVTSGGGVLSAGDRYSASWNDVPNDEGNGMHAGSLVLVLDPERKEVLSFQAHDVLTLDDGTVATSAASGWHVPLAEGAPGVLEFTLRGADSFDHLTEFTHDWAFADGNTREVTAFTCDEYSLIRITIE